VLRRRRGVQPRHLRGGELAPTPSPIMPANAAIEGAYSLNRGWNKTPLTSPNNGVRADQAKCGVFFLRLAMKASPQKPKIIIAQVEGSGTAD
jgi:hypothetical protein